VCYEMRPQIRPIQVSSAVYKSLQLFFYACNSSIHETIIIAYKNLDGHFVRKGRFCKKYDFV
jgi:hypothetical protein